jgi:hypothetical protein
MFLAACVAPARDTSDYRYKAALALEEAHSSIQAADLAVALMDGRDLPLAPVEVVARESEGTIAGTQSQFGSVKPPTAQSAGIRDRVLDLLDQAYTPVEEARIALQQGDRKGAVEAMQGASALAEELSSASDELTAANE